MAAVMSMTVFAQRIDNTIKEARILTDKMVEEVNLNNWQREKAKRGCVRGCNLNCVKACS